MIIFHCEQLVDRTISNITDLIVTWFLSYKIIYVK